MKRNFLQRNTKKLIAAGLIFWLSGIAFLFCCQMPMMAAQAAEKDSCPLAKTNHCNRKTSGENSSQFASLKSEDRALDCCILPNIFDKARKVEPKNLQLAGISFALKISAPKFFVAEKKFTRPAIYRAIILNSRETYLRNQVFRI